MYSLFTIGGICCERLVYVDAIKKSKDNDGLERSRCSSMSQSIGLGSLFDLNYLYFTKNCCNIIVIDLIFDSNDSIKYGFVDNKELRNMFHGDTLSNYVFNKNNAYLPPNININASNNNPIHIDNNNNETININNSYEVKDITVSINVIDNISNITDRSISELESINLPIEINHEIDNKRIENDTQTNEKSIIDDGINDFIETIEALHLTKNEIVKKDAIHLFKR